MKILITLSLFAGSLAAQFTNPIYPVSASSGTMIPYDFAEGRQPALQSWDSAIAFVDQGGVGRARELHIGDSWATGLSNELRTYLQTVYPNAGYGYSNFVSITANQGFAGTVTQTGTWANTNSVWTGAFGMGSYTTTSSDIAAPANIHVVFSTPAQYVTIYFINTTSGGTFQFRRTASGTQTAYTIQSTTGANNTLGSVTFSAGNNSITDMDIQMVSGTVILSGMDVNSGIPGPAVHNIGIPGSRAVEWAGADAALWQSEIAALSPNVVVIQFGVNELLQNNTPASQIAAIAVLVGRIQAVVPDAGIVLMPPAHISDILGHTYLMRDYVDAQEVYARQNGLGFFCMYKLITPYDSPFAAGRGQWANPTHLQSRGHKTAMNAFGQWLMLAARH